MHLINASAHGVAGKDDTCNAGEQKEPRVPSLGRKDPLKKEMATHSSTLAWEIPWTGKLDRVIEGVEKESDTTINA